KQLREGKTPRFVLHRDGKVPPRPSEGPFPPPVGSPKSVLGFWEAVSTSRGGIGSAIEFRPGGTVRTRMVIMHQGRYRIEGDRLVVGDEGASESAPLGKIENDRWTVEPADGPKVVR